MASSGALQKRRYLLLCFSLLVATADIGIGDASVVGQGVEDGAGQAGAVVGETVGCYVYHQKFTPALEGMPLWNVGNAGQCQRRCYENHLCKVFGYFADIQACWLGPKGAYHTPDPVAVSGPEVCPLIPTWCSEVPDPAQFPGPNTHVSDAAWKVDMTPPNLQCWPHTLNRKPEACSDEPVTVIEDTTYGWPGTCLGLREVRLPPGETCERYCLRDIYCSEYSLTKGWQGNGEQCWHGLGHSCYKTQDWTPLRAQRFMHGHYRVVRDMTGFNVLNLIPVDVSNDGGIENTSNVIGVQRCNRTCLQLVNCQIWTYSTISGCSIEHPSIKQIAYPASLKTMIPGATDVIAGQYLQRYCKLGVFENASAQPATEIKRATCDTYVCPAGYVVKSHNHLIPCAAQTCTSSDLESCCDVPAKCGSFACPTGYNLRLDAAVKTCSAKTCSVNDLQTCCLYANPQAPAPATKTVTVPVPVPVPVPVQVPVAVTHAPTMPTVAPTPPPTVAVLAFAAAGTGAVPTPAPEPVLLWDDLSFLYWLVPVFLAILGLGAAVMCCIMGRSSKSRGVDVLPFPEGPEASPYTSLATQSQNSSFMESGHYAGIDAGNQPLYQSITATGPQTMLMENVSAGPRGGTLHTITEYLEVPAGTPGAVPVIVAAE